MKQLIFYLSIILSVGCSNSGQQKGNVRELSDSLLVCEKIASLINAKTGKPFNGSILISQNGKIMYSKIMGYSDIEKKTPLKPDDQFVIGSISKQFATALVLREYDNGNIKLHIPIRHYLQDIKQAWADTVTIHHLLTHMHGIESLDQPLAFPAGTQFEYGYSNTGFNLLATILEKVAGKSFMNLSAGMFAECGMKNTFHPDLKLYKNLVKGYTENDLGMAFEINSFQNAPAAGSFISTATDLMLWDMNFFGGKLLSDSTMKLMTTKQKNAIRDHPTFGKTNYGLGISIDTKDSILQWGQTGFAPGFASMNFYFPESKTCVIVLQNIVYKTDDLKMKFYYHTGILKIIRESNLVVKKPY